MRQFLPLLVLLAGCQSAIIKDNFAWYPTGGFPPPGVRTPGASSYLFIRGAPIRNTCPIDTPPAPSTLRFTELSIGDMPVTLSQKKGDVTGIQVEKSSLNCRVLWNLALAPYNTATFSQLIDCTTGLHCEMTNQGSWY